MKKKPPAHVGEALAKMGVHKALAAYVLAVPVLFLAASLFGKTNVIVLLWGLVTWGLAAAGLAWLLEKGGVRTASTREKMKEVLRKALARVLPERRIGADAGPVDIGARYQALLDGDGSGPEAVLSLLEEVLSRQEAVRAKLDLIRARFKEVQAFRGLAHDRLDSALRLLNRDLLPETPFPQRLALEAFEMHCPQDGVVLHLLRACGSPNRSFVEITRGASSWKGGVLAHELGWRGIVVEYQKKKAAEAERAFRDTAVDVVHQDFHPETYPESLDALLRRHGFAGEVDFLSISGGGGDLTILKALPAVTPRLIAIAYDSDFGPSRQVEVPYDDGGGRDPGGRAKGSSLAAVAAMAAGRGWRLVGCDEDGINAFFIRKDLAPEIPEQKPEAAFRAREGGAAPQPAPAAETETEASTKPVVAL